MCRGHTHDLKVGGQYIETNASELFVLRFGVAQYYFGGVADSVDLFTNPAGTFDSLGRNGGAQQTGRFFGLYVQDSVSIGERWNVTAGLRYDFSKLWIPGQTRRDSP